MLSRIAVNMMYSGSVRLYLWQYKILSFVVVSGNFVRYVRKIAAFAELCMACDLFHAYILFYLDRQNSHAQKNLQMRFLAPKFCPNETSCALAQVGLCQGHGRFDKMLPIR